MTDRTTQNAQGDCDYHTHMPGLFSNKVPNDEHVAILGQGVEAWNAWRKENPYTIPVIARVDLGTTNLRGINLCNVDMTRAVFRSCDLSGADLYQGELYGVDLRDTKLIGAEMRGSKLHRTDLRGADMTNADLFRADFISAQLDGANLSGARCLTTAFSDVDLSNVQGLTGAVHNGPSSIDSSTLLRSGGEAAEMFFRNAGVPQALIQEARRLRTMAPSLQSSSVFISYSSDNGDIATRIYDALQRNGVRVWFAPHAMRSGQLLFEQIDDAIQVHDRVLILLSESSIKSAWVKTELIRAWHREKTEDRRILFPVSIMPFEQLRPWRCMDPDTGVDVAAYLRAYFVPDLSEWTNEDTFEQVMLRIVADLRA